MGREVFQANKIVLIGFAVVFSLVFIIVYTQTDLPLWALAFVLGLAFLLVVSSLKTKVVIEHGLLRYEMLFGGEEVELKQVSQILTREVETFGERTGSGVGHSRQSGGIQIGNIRIGNSQERKIEKVVYILDDAGRTFFSFPANLIGFKHRTRFRKAVQAVNPNIEVF